RRAPDSSSAGSTRPKPASTDKERDMRSKGMIAWGVLGVAALGLLSGRCAPSAPRGAKKASAAVSDVAVAAQKTYVAPGDLDEYYLFGSGGHSGQVYVYGVTSIPHTSSISRF